MEQPLGAEKASTIYMLRNGERMRSLGMPRVQLTGHLVVMSS